MCKITSSSSRAQWLLALLSVALFAACVRSPEPFQSPPATRPPEPTPTQPSSPLPTPTPFPAARCKFGPPLTPPPGGTGSSYIFSEPQVVLTRTAYIVGWLPDNRRLLITELVSGTNRQRIETFNVNSGEVHLYAERVCCDGNPVWIPELEAIAYSTLTDQAHELWLSAGDPTQVKRLTSSVGSGLAVDPKGPRLIYFPTPLSGQPQLMDLFTQTIQPLPVDLAQWQFSKYPPEMEALRRWDGYATAWQPNGSQLVFYTWPWTFLYDMPTNQVCELDLGRSQVEGMPNWALEVNWSPDGRYLAFITTGTFPGQPCGGAAICYSELTILDTKTSDLRTLQPAPDIVPGQHYVTDLAWAPDSRRLAALATLRIEEGLEKQGLFIIDATTGAVGQAISAQDLVNNGGPQLAWSPDGSQLAVNCSTSEGGRLCMVSVSSQ